MAVKVDIYLAPEKQRSRTIATAMERGIRRHGIPCRVLPMTTFRHPQADVAVFYGLMRAIMQGYRRANRPSVYVDLGYWGRHEGGRREGFHKVSVNGRHPTSYFQRVKHDSKRFDHFNIPVKAWRGPNPNGYIMLAGMSAKAANAEGFQPEEWERTMIAKIRQHTDREIIYRPKPNWINASQLDGSRMARGDDGDVENYFEKCHSIVTHHSNVSVEGLLYGVPVFCWDGVATAPGKACSDISMIENPPAAVDREQWAHDIAWTQWNVAEMASGNVWRYLQNEGLVPK